MAMTLLKCSPRFFGFFSITLPLHTLSAGAHLYTEDVSAFQVSFPHSGCLNRCSDFLQLTFRASCCFKKDYFSCALLNDSNMLERYSDWEFMVPINASSRTNCSAISSYRLSNLSVAVSMLVVKRSIFYGYSSANYHNVHINMRSGCQCSGQLRSDFW